MNMMKMKTIGMKKVKNKNIIKIDQVLFTAYISLSILNIQIKIQSHWQSAFV